MGQLREMAEETGLVDAVTAALIGTYRGVPLHEPGRVFTDLAVAVTDGADAVSGIAVLGDRQDLFGSVASMPTAWQVLDRVGPANLPAVRMARAVARERAWAAGAGPDLGAELAIDFDATITIAHSENENAAATWKKTFGFHPLLALLDRPDIAGGEGLAGLLRAGNAGSNTAADHIAVRDMALAALPAHARPRPGIEGQGSPGNRCRALDSLDRVGRRHLVGVHGCPPSELTVVAAQQAPTHQAGATGPSSRAPGTKRNRICATVGRPFALSAQSILSQEQSGGPEVTRTHVQVNARR